MNRLLILSMVLAVCFVSVAGAYDDPIARQHAKPAPANPGQLSQPADDHRAAALTIQNTSNNERPEALDGALTIKPLSPIAEDQVTARGLRASETPIGRSDGTTVIDPPPNDLCQDITPVPLVVGTPLTFTGNNVDATQQCLPPLGSFAEVWHAITTTECMNIKIDYCGTDPMFNDVYIIMNTGCPCDARIRADYWTQNDCPDWNYSVYFYNVPAGTYYIPVLSDVEHGAWGPYTMNVNGTQCSPPPNNNCTSVTPVALSAGDTLTFSGDNRFASSDCPLLDSPEVWHSIVTTQYLDLTVDYCGTDPVFGNVFIALSTGCPCDSLIITNDYTQEMCGDGNYKIFFYNVPPDTYYIPILNDPFSEAAGLYTMHVSAAACPPPPANDNCASVVPVTLTPGVPAAFTGTTVGATIDCPTNAYPSTTPYPEVWHAITLTECMNIRVDYCGTNPAFGNIFSSMYAGCPCSDLMRTVYFSSSECTDGNYSIFFNRVAPGTYYIPILRDFSYGASGPYALTVTGTACPAPLPNDNCQNVTPVPLVAYDTLTFTGTNEWATPDCPTQEGHPQVWEAFSTFENLDVTISYCGTDPVFNSVDLILADQCPCGPDFVYFSSYNTSSCIDGNATIFFVTLPPGTYYLPIYSSPYNQGNYMVKITGDAIIPPSTNDNCADAIAIGDVTRLPFNTTTATLDGPGLCDTGFNIWYKYTATCTGMATIDLCSSRYDTKVAVYDGGSCDPFSAIIACNDDYCNVQSKIHFMCVQGNEYLIDIGGFEGSVGTGYLTTYCAQAPPPTPTCDPASLFGQSPSGFLEMWNFNVSDANSSPARVIYENFSGVAGNICGVRFWGFDLYQGNLIEECTEINMQFRIVFYSDNAGMPGDTVASYTVTPSRVNTGNWYHDEFELNEYVADLGDCVTLAGGWISIEGITFTPDHDCWFFWMDTHAGDDLAYQREGTNWYPIEYDQSFCLIGSGGGCAYIPGDMNGIGGANGIDVVYGVNFLKGGQPPTIDCNPPCTGQPDPFYAAMDVNGNCSANGIDVTYFVAFLKGQQPILKYCQACPPAGLAAPGPGDRPAAMPINDINRSSKADESR